MALGADPSELTGPHGGLNSPVRAAVPLASACSALGCCPPPAAAACLPATQPPFLPVQVGAVPWRQRAARRPAAWLLPRPARRPRSRRGRSRGRQRRSRCSRAADPSTGARPPHRARCVRLMRGACRGDRLEMNMAHLVAACGSTPWQASISSPLGPNRPPQLPASGPCSYVGLQLVFAIEHFAAHSRCCHALLGSCLQTVSRCTLPASHLAARATLPNQPGTPCPRCRRLWRANVCGAECTVRG